jgi:Tfp pilus assembly protein PilF
MPPIRSLAAALLAAALTLGCSTGPLSRFSFARDAGMPYLEEGIHEYEEGNYHQAARRLQFALEEGLPKTQRVKAHKYLAFIACISGQQLNCKEEFALALRLDPQFELDSAEAGHPIWGPVYKNVKAKKAAQ